MTRHLCEISRGRYESRGGAIECCYEDDDGRFWVYSGASLGNTVRFCPECGAKAPEEPA